MGTRDFHGRNAVGENGGRARGVTRRDFLRLGGTSLAGAVALGGIAGCGGGETIGGGGGASGGSILTIGRGADSVGLDPVHVTDGESLSVTGQIFDKLLDFAPDSTEVVPALATEVPEPREGGLVYGVPLREGVEFHDGEPFDAEAVVFNFDRWRFTDDDYHAGGGSQGSNFAYYSILFGGFDDDSIIESVEAVDEYTVRFTLREPLGPFNNNLAASAFGIASPAAIRENVEEFWQNPVGTGPYRFGSWNQGTEVRLRRVEGWWGTELPEDIGGGRPLAERIIFRAIEDNASRVAALAGGDLSVAEGLTPDDVPTIRESGDLKIQTELAVNLAYLAMNNRREPFGDERVRRAVAHAVNLEEIVASFFGETGEVATTPMPPTLDFFDESVEPYGYDPDEARRLLEEAGLPDGFSATLWYVPVPRPYLPDGRGVAQAIQQDLQEVGIEVSLETRDFGAFVEAIGRGEHDMAIYGWSSGNGDADYHLNSLLNSANATDESAQNISFYENPEVDDLLNEARATVEEDERRELYARAQRIIHEEAPMLPLVYAEPAVGLQRSVEGYTTTPGGDSLHQVSPPE